MGKTKIVYTMKPSADRLKLWKMYEAGGMDVVRCVFSGENDTDYILWVQEMKQICKESQRPVSILLDAEEKEVILADAGMVQEIDYVSTTSIHSKEDAINIRRFLDENGCGNTQIIAKLDGIQKHENPESLMEAVDGIMLTAHQLVEF